MKILFWTDGFWPRLGGIETHGFELIQGLQARGHQCSVVAQRDRGGKEGEVYEGIPIHRFDFNEILAKRELKTMRKIQEHLTWVAQEFRPDLIHLNACVGGSAFVFSLCMQQLQLPFVLTAHAPYLLEGKIPPVVAQIAGRARGIGCVSNWVLREMATHLPAVRQKLRLIHNGLPFPHTPLAPLPWSPPTLLLFGRLSPEKGFDVAVQAFALLKQRGSDARLLIAGGGVERARLEKLVEALSLSASTEFTGVLAPGEVAPTFDRATLVVVSSLIESFGLVILEAMQRGRPVVASRVEGIPEVVSDGETGLLVPPSDPVALSAAIEALLTHPERASRMGQAGHIRASQFPIHRNVDEFEQLYRDALG